jgi:hypothetical protein
MWIEIYFSVLEKATVAEIYSFCKEGIMHTCRHVEHLEPGWTTLSPNSPHRVKTKKLGCSI